MQEDPFVLSFASIYNAPPHKLDSRIGRLVKLIFEELRLIECANIVWEGLSGTDYCLILSVLRVWPGTVPLGDEGLPARAAAGQLTSF